MWPLVSFRILLCMLPRLHPVCFTLPRYSSKSFAKSLSLFYAMFVFFTGGFCSSHALPGISYSFLWYCFSRAFLYLIKLYLLSHLSNWGDACIWVISSDTQWHDTNNSNQTFYITADQSYTSAWRYFSLLFYAEWFKPWDVGGFPHINWNEYVRKGNKQNPWQKSIKQQSSSCIFSV